MTSPASTATPQETEGFTHHQIPVIMSGLMLGMFLAALDSRTGRYRWFPLAGTIGVTIGLGLFMQVLTPVVQNAVPRLMGVATSSVTFFRSMGGAIVASALGAVLTAGIAAEFLRYLPRADLAKGGNSGSKVAQLIQSPAVLDALKRTNPALHEGIIQAYAHAIDRLFVAAVPVSVLSIIAALFVRQVKLRTSNTPSQAAAGNPTAGAAAAPPAPGGMH